MSSEARSGSILMPPTDSSTDSQNTQDICVRQLPVADLAAVLTETLARLSPTRINIISDQLRAVLKSDRRDDLIVLAASPDAANLDVTSLDSSVVLIATIPEQGDTGAVLHADWARPDHPGGVSLAASCASAIAERLFEIFAAHQVRFIQWSTDPDSTADPNSNTGHPTDRDADHSVLVWPRRMGFKIVGTLEYMTIDLKERAVDNLNQTSSPLTTSIDSLDHTSDNSVKAFEEMVRATYTDSLDCPLLEQYRSSSEIVDSYRHADAFSPELWFNVHATTDGNSFQPIIGCVVLAKHADSVTGDLVLELVYMGVVPQHRGKKYGSEIMQQILLICERENAVRLVLAVDQRNRPAITAYKRLGMQGLFRETVWVHSGKTESFD